MKSNISQYLIQVLQKKGITYYGDLITHFGLSELNGIWRSHPLCQIFADLDHEDAQANRPFRTSVVIGRQTNMPGDGFFETLQQLKQINDPVNTEARVAVWLKELKEAHQYPWSVEY